MPFPATSPPDDADIQALKTLIHHYKDLEFQFYDPPNRDSGPIDRQSFEPVLWSVLNYFDELIAAGKAKAIREEDVAIIQRFRTIYATGFITLRAMMDYQDAAFSVKMGSLFGDISGIEPEELSLNTSKILLQKSPCFYPTLLQPESVNVRVLQALAKKYDVVLLLSKTSTTSALLENRPIARHEFAAALDRVLEKAVGRFKKSPRLVPEADRVTLQWLYNDYAIELTSRVLLGAQTKLYTYCLN